MRRGTRRFDRVLACCAALLLLLIPFVQRDAGSTDAAAFRVESSALGAPDAAAYRAVLMLPAEDLFQAHLSRLTRPRTAKNTRLLRLQCTAFCGRQCTVPAALRRFSVPAPRGIPTRIPRRFIIKYIHDQDGHKLPHLVLLQKMMHNRTEVSEHGSNSADRCMPAALSGHDRD